jgi:phage baseplate assembly protein W
MSDLLLGTPYENVTSLDLSRKFALDNLSDLQYDARGQLITVSGADKVRQYVGKILLSFQGDNTIDPVYGTTINSFIGTKITDETNYSLIKQTIIDAISYAIQKYNDSLDETEQINSIDSFSTMISSQVNETTHLVIQVELTTAAGESVIVGTTI